MVAGDVVTRRLLFVHAHPDDESITTGATIARYRSLGVEVAVVTCTLGEEGEVIGDEWAGLVAAEADQLGGYRIRELDRALTALGVDRPRFLGGAGRWRDSGMVGTASAEHPRAFVNAGVDAVAALVAFMRSFQPHVVVTYDPNGGYGHPDHIQAHRITTAAVEQVPPQKFYWIVDPAEATTVVDGDLDAKVAALRAHATQITVSADGTGFQLSNNIPHPLTAVECFRLVAGTGPERDLFDGIAE